MWELFFEQPLYPNLNVYEITTKIVQEFLRPEIPKEHDVPKEIVDLMKKCWNTDPEKRPHWKEIIQILKQLVKEKYGDSMHNFPKVEL
jgi:proto-oncogene tyrosine-protein kinase Kit